MECWHFIRTYRERVACQSQHLEDRPAASKNIARTYFDHVRAAVMLPVSTILQESVTASKPHNTDNTRDSNKQT